MGVYLSSPCTIVEVEEGTGNNVEFALGTMQGWRVNMEDAHIALTYLSDTEPNALLFSVFDGHGGKEVSRFCELKFKDELVSSELFKQGNYAEALVSSFHRMDEMLEDMSNETLLKRMKQYPNPSDTEQKSRRRKLQNHPKDLPESHVFRHYDSKIPKKSSNRHLDNKVNAAKDARNTLSVDDASPPLSSSPDKSPSPVNSPITKKLNDIGLTNNEIDVFKKLLLAGDTKKKAASVCETDPDEDAEPLQNEPVCTLPDHRVAGGCTAIVSLVIQGKLYVANAGDSRAVLCRAGQAIELSEDHKPNNETEIKRITAAGGFVSAIGRVNRNLNLSRSIGDLKYKQQKSIPKSAQIITAEPDVTVTDLCAEDQFLILGCDGVWDCMSSQEACDFVTSKLAEGLIPAEIVKQMFTVNLSEDPKTTKGIGGDNMTCIIVLLNAAGNYKAGIQTSDSTVGTVSRSVTAGATTDKEGGSS